MILITINLTLTINPFLLNLILLFSRMAVSKITLPADFGIENLDCPGHSNIDVMLKGEEVLKVNSIILGLHSPVFQKMFKVLSRTSVDFSDFPTDISRSFFSALYDGNLDITKENLRAFLKIAVIFRIEWIESRCMLGYFILVKSYVEKYNKCVGEGGGNLLNVMVEMKWALNELFSRDQSSRTQSCLISHLSILKREWTKEK